MKNIKVGQVWQDGWERKWQVIKYHALTDRWSMRLWSYNCIDDFSTYHIFHNFKLIYP